MRYDSVDMQGPLLIEKLTSLPTWTSADQRRIVLIDEGDNTYSIYYGDVTQWRRLDFPIDSLTGDNIFVAYNGTDFYLTDSLPNQSGMDGRYLKSDGTNAEWYQLIQDDILPNQSGQTAKFLQTDGTKILWASTPTELPSKSGNNGKILTVDSSETLSLKWVDVSDAIGLPSKSGHADEFLQVNSAEDDILWNSPFPVHSGDEKFLSYDGITRSWNTILQVPTPSVRSVLMTDGSVVEWDTNNVIPNQYGKDGDVLSTNGDSLVWTDISDSTWITIDTIWLVPTDYATLELALAELDNYYIHPNATLTIQLSGISHNVTDKISITNRGKNEGIITIRGTAGTILTSDNFNNFDQGVGGSFIEGESSKIKFETLEIVGPGNSVDIGGMNFRNQSCLTLNNITVKDFYTHNILVTQNSMGLLTNIITTGNTLWLSIGAQWNSYILGGNIDIVDTSITSQLIAALQTSTIRLYDSSIDGGLTGLTSRENSYISFIRSSIIRGLIGVHSYMGSSIALQEYDVATDTSTIDQCTTGIWVQNNSTVESLNTVVTNTNVAYYAFGGSFIRVSSPTLSGNNYNYSPAINTQGNHNSFISSI